VSEPDQIDMMSEQELRAELRKLVKASTPAAEQIVNEFRLYLDAAMATGEVRSDTDANYIVGLLESACRELAPSPAQEQPVASADTRIFQIDRALVHLQCGDTESAEQILCGLRAALATASSQSPSTPERVRRYE
jgi:hypothetical protein